MAGENKAFVEWVRTRRCLMWMHGGCGGPIQAHHAGPRGFGMRAHDETCIPLCREHHQAWHDVRPPFRQMGKEGRAAWRDSQIAAVQASWRTVA